MAKNTFVPEVTFKSATIFDIGLADPNVPLIFVFNLIMIIAFDLFIYFFFKLSRLFPSFTI